MDEYSDAWISTQLVPRFYFLDPVEEDIRSSDIAHALSMTCRFGGHTKSFYSVAEHSVIVSEVLENDGASPLTVLAGLFHDAEEAYLPDIPAPVKAYMPEAWSMYEILNNRIIKKFGLQKADWRQIKYIDRRLCIAEAKILGLWNENWAEVSPPLEVKLHKWSQKKAKDAFLDRYISIRVHGAYEQWKEEAVVTE